jgi:hypothetical protein
MPNLKPYLDAAVSADAAVQRVMAEIDIAFNLGTPEGQTQALELRPTLDAAKANAKSANELYVSMRDASLVSDNAAANFTAPADPAAQPEQKKAMTRSAFDALEPNARMEFIRARGKITEDEVK